MDCEGPGPKRDGEHEVAAHDCESAVEASAVLVGGLGLGVGELELKLGLALGFDASLQCGSKTFVPLIRR